MDIIEIIKKRKSCRTFSHVALKPEDKKNLESFIIENSKGFENEVVNFRIIEKNNYDKQMKLDYGMIKGHNTYILGTAKSTTASRVNYGYLMEKVVLKATEMNLSTCWIGAFDCTYFNELSIEDGFEIPSIVIVGYSDDKPTYQDKFLRFSVKASKRQGWDKLFFNYRSKTSLTPEYIKKYSESLEMVRLAPSSGNNQPWRVFFDETMNEFHF
jgi:nitroreductase